MFVIKLQTPLMVDVFRIIYETHNSDEVQESYRNSTVSFSD